MDPTLETVVLEGNHSLKSLHYQCAAFEDDHGWHFHPEYEISYIVQGQGTRFVGDSVEYFYPGDLVIVGPNTPHCWISNEDHRENEMIVLQFLPDCLGEPFLEVPEAKAFKTLLEQAKRGMHYQNSAEIQAQKHLEAIAQSAGLMRIAHFIQLIDNLCQSTVKSPLTSELYLTDNREFNSGRLGKVMNYVTEHMANEIKQTDVAKVVNMTPQSFSRFFRATTGRTFVTFVNMMRITHACRLLASGDHDITYIAFECGYSNLSNFNRRFSEIKQCTPSEYRNKHHMVLKTQQV
ncbi:MAG: AraC family transcriptional regulator [Alteromonadaceae bacterium]|nr:MAG: AraC family transcriptional regulator [Alteromonadaceae bacterium]